MEDKLKDIRHTGNKTSECCYYIIQFGGYARQERQALKSPNVCSSYNAR